MILTSKDYLRAVLSKFELEKRGNYGSFFLNPSPAELLNLCLIIYDKGLSNADKATFANYFQPKHDTDLRKTIVDYISSDFKAINFFLIGKTKEPNLKNLELVAVLVDFNPRPLSKFLDEGRQQQQIRDEVFVKDEVFEIPSKEEGIITENLGKSKWRKILPYATFILGFIFIGYLFSTYTTKQCMQWQTDHYEPIDCQEVSKFETPIVALKEELLHFRQLYPKKEDPFIQNGQPIIWYSKKDNVVEFFNADGKHPINGKNLGPVNFYIMHKHGR